MRRDWLKELRTANGLSQAETAKKAGISQAYYASIESGIRGNKGVNVQAAKKIAKALGFSWTRFFDDIG